MANFNFVITILCPKCSNFTELPLSRFEVLTDGDYLGSCKKCDTSIKIRLTSQAVVKPLAADLEQTTRKIKNARYCIKCGGWLFRETLKTPLPQLDTPCAECGHQKSAHWHRDSGGAYEFADCGGVFDDVCGCKKYRATT